MKTKLLITLIFFAFCIGFLAVPVDAQMQRRVLMEYCTGQWCGYCPCGHDIINQNIIPTYPSTVILSYHGGTSSVDSMKGFHGSEIRTLLAFNLYPNAIFDRTTTQLTRSLWMGQMATCYATPSNVNVTITNKQYNPGTRQLNVTVTATALSNLSGTYSINFVLTEDSLIKGQTFYASCGTAGYHYPYVHGHVTRDMINGAAGELIHSSGQWNTGVTYTKTISYTIADTINASNSHLAVFVYNSTNGVALGTVQQTTSIGVIEPLGIGNQSGNTPVSFVLYQNYPNPFNPITTISYYLPKDEHVLLKVYNLLGEEVYTLVNANEIAGEHSLNFDGYGLASGIYIYKITAGDFTDIKKMILIK
jgi:hypothetical protein